MDWEPEAFEALSFLTALVPLDKRDAAEVAAIDAAQGEAVRRGLDVVDVECAVVGFVRIAPRGSEASVQATLDRLGLAPERFRSLFRG